MKHLQPTPKLTLDTTTADQLLITTYNLYQKNNYEMIVTLLSSIVDQRMAKKSTQPGNDFCHYIKWLGAAHYMLKHFTEANKYFEYLNKFCILNKYDMDDEVSKIWQDSKQKMSILYKPAPTKQQENLLVNALDFVYQTAYSHFTNKEYQKAIDVLDQVISDQYEFNKFNKALLDLHFQASSELVLGVYSQNKTHNSVKQVTPILPQNTTTSSYTTTVSPPNKAAKKIIQGDPIIYSPNYYELIKAQTLIGQNNYEQAYLLIQNVLNNTNTTTQDAALANSLLKSIPIEQQKDIYTEEQQVTHESKKQKTTSTIICDETLSPHTDDIPGQDELWNLDYFYLG